MPPRFWDLGRDQEQDPWGKRRPRMHQTLDPPDLSRALRLLPWPYRWAINILLIGIVLLVMFLSLGR
jgi:hypothetical protein